MENNSRRISEDLSWALVLFALATIASALTYVLIATKSSNVSATLIERHLVDGEPSMYFKADEEIVEVSASIPNFIGAKEGSQWCLKKTVSKYFSSDHATYRVFTQGRCSDLYSRSN